MTHSPIIIDSKITPSSITTGGVYKEQGHIHRRILNWRLLAIPCSWVLFSSQSLMFYFLSISYYIKHCIARAAQAIKGHHWPVLASNCSFEQAILRLHRLRKLITKSLHLLGTAMHHHFALVYILVEQISLVSFPALSQIKPNNPHLVVVFRQFL